MVFIELEKAYDRVHRAVLWWAFKEKGVPEEYVQLIRAMYNHTSGLKLALLTSSVRLHMTITQHLCYP